MRVNLNLTRLNAGEIFLTCGQPAHHANKIYANFIIAVSGNYTQVKARNLKCM